MPPGPLTPPRLAGTTDPDHGDLPEGLAGYV